MSRLDKKAFLEAMAILDAGKVGWARAFIEAYEAARQPPAAVAPEQPRAWTIEDAARLHNVIVDAGGGIDFYRTSNAEMLDWLREAFPLAPVASPEQATAAVAPRRVVGQPVVAAHKAYEDNRCLGHTTALMAALDAYEAGHGTSVAPATPRELPTTEELARAIGLSPAYVTREACRAQAEAALYLITTREAVLRQEVDNLREQSSSWKAEADDHHSAWTAATQEIERLKVAYDAVVSASNYTQPIVPWTEDVAEKLNATFAAIRCRSARDDMYEAGRRVFGALCPSTGNQLAEDLADYKQLLSAEQDRAENFEAERDQLKRELDETREAYQAVRDELMRAAHDVVDHKNEAWALGEQKLRAEARSAILDGQLKALRGAPAGWEHASPADKLRPNDRHALRQVDESPFEELRRRVEALETVVRGLCEAGMLGGIGEKS